MRSAPPPIAKRKSHRRESAERAFAVALAPQVLRSERRTARALVNAERRTLRDLRAAVEPVVSRAALAVAHDGVQRRDAMATVRRTVPALRDAAERALLAARTSARRDGRAALDRPGHALPPEPEEDSAASHTAASAYAAAWGAFAMLAIVTWSDKRDGSLARHLAPEPLDHRLRRIAATETARAFNDERARAMTAWHAPEAGAFKIWSAVLDRKTCPYCFGRDGETIALHQSFGATPPVHVCCRCVITFVAVPKPERLDDVAIDYDLFKQEMRDVICERRVESERHAARFVRASMGGKRSPSVLTRNLGKL